MTDRWTSEQLLVGLGKTPRTVGRRLRRAGIKGARRNAYDCPIAAFLSARTGKKVSVQRHSCREIGSDNKIPMPHPVWQFMLQFDNGYWPELEGESS